MRRREERWIDVSLLLVAPCLDQRLYIDERVADLDDTRVCRCINNTSSNTTDRWAPIHRYAIPHLPTWMETRWNAI